MENTIDKIKQLQNTKNFQKYIKTPYWSISEELQLLELWRKHIIEINEDFTTNHPAFRQIAEAMRIEGYSISSIECRRKLQSLYNKYLKELQHINVSQSKKSEWKLFPIIDYMLKTKFEPKMYLQKQELVDRASQRFGIDKLILNKSEEQTSFPKGHSIYIWPKESSNLSEIDDNVEENLNPIQLSKTANGSLKVTMDHINQIREDNRLLCLKRDISLKRLRLEINELAYLMYWFSNWQKTENEILKSLKYDNITVSNNH